MLLKKITLITSAVLTTLCIASIASAAPYSGEQMSFKQPDGTSINVKVYGDEFYQRVESLDGYSLIRDDKTQWICYAELDSTKSELVSTGIRYPSNTRSGSLNITKGLTEKSSVISKKAKAEQDRHSWSKILKEASQSAQSRKAAQAAQAKKGSTGTSVGILSAPPPSSVTGLTILIDFSDQQATIPVANLNNMLNQTGYTGYGNNGSIKDYFYDMSGGALTLTNNVIGYYRASKTKAYYDANENSGPKACELINEALAALDATNNFSTLTKDSKNKAISLNVFYAGSPSWGWNKGLWAHAWKLSSCNKSYIGDGVTFDTYCISPITNDPSIRTTCHETCHSVLGYPDTYDYGDDSSGTGNFDIMSDTLNDKNPLPIDPYMRNIISGFGTATSLNNVTPATIITLTANSLNSYIYRKPNSTTEYFMLESISKTGRRNGMPGSGLLIWHIDENVTTGNDNQPHYKVSVEQADGLNHLENNTNSGQQEDFFYAPNKTSFNPDTTPSSKWWDGTRSNLSIENINANGTQFKLYPASPANFRMTARANMIVEFSWDSLAAGTTYAIYRKYHGTTNDPVKIVETEETVETVSTSYGSYDYYVAVVNSSGDRISGFTPPINVEAYVPAPSNFSLTSRTDLTVNFSWSSAGSGKRYAVYRKYHGSASDPEKLTETTNTAASVSTLNGSCDFFVAIVDSFGNRISSYSSSVTVDVYLSAPSNFAANISDSYTNFTWNSLTGATRYGIYRRVNGSTADPTLVAQTPYTYKLVNNVEGTYDYFVAAVDPNGGGNRISSFSSAQTVTYNP